MTRQRSVVLVELTPLIALGPNVLAVDVSMTPCGLILEVLVAQSTSCSQIGALTLILSL